MKSKNKTTFIFIAYYFPPIGGAGVQRTLKFIKYLPGLGYLPIMVTGPGSLNDHWSPIDNTLEREVSNRIIIYRFKTLFEPPHRIASKIHKYFMARTSFSRWWFSNCVDMIERILKHEKPEFIFSSMSPFESAHIADYIYRKHGIPWIADLRDPWALDEMQLYPTQMHFLYAKKKMRKLLSSATGIVMNTPEAKSRVLKAFPEYGQKKIISIPNGYDSDDFKYKKSKKNEKFTIVHTGYLHTESGLSLRKNKLRYSLLGGAADGLDILTRSHVFLMDAIKKWIDEEPNIGKSIEIKLAGRLSNLDLKIIADSQISNLISTPGYLSHDESIELIQSADLLFLPMHNLPGTTRSTIVPGKTYEYMATGTPILAAIPEGDAKDFLLKRGKVYICQPDDISSMVDSLSNAFRSWKADDPGNNIDMDYVSTFDRKYLTERLASFLHEIF